MKKTNKTKLSVLALSFLVITLLSVTTVEGLFPKTHAYIISESCEKGYSSDLALLCCNDIDACIAGNTLADISVLCYLEAGFMKYTVTHSDVFCREVISEARNPTEQAVAAGMCLHHTGADRVAHNVLVPYTIRKTGIPNYIIHPFSEQKVDNYVLKIDPGATDTLNSAMNGSLEYVDFLQRTLQPNPAYGDIDVRELTLGFIQQVRQSESGYDVSFQTIKAVPNSIFYVLGAVLILSIWGVVWIIRRTNRTFSTIFSMIMLSLIALIIIVAVIATIMGQVWVLFTSITKPVSVIVPTPNEALIVDQAIQHTENMFQFGIDYVLTLPPELQDTTGIKPNVGGIWFAEQETKSIRWVYIGVIVGFVVLMGYFVRKNRKSKRGKGLRL